MPWCELSHARRLFSGTAFLVTLRVWLLLLRRSPAAHFPCRAGQHLAAVRLRLDNLFIKQSTVDLRELCVSWMKGALRERGCRGCGACGRRGAERASRRVSRGPGGSFM